ncbi:hypothetical protein KZ820_20955 [Sphingomonas sp. RRHST34]|uniref:Uncharacterized protein n=1 Tax=Sphingomonas citri TaxID=2862499 RepID=A0ABS7BUE2_9SPHN|nr:hypothetical protein [Sphingomonas citri]MBW6533219.1 hypothetical protein [Sphingomonas citri]
MHDDNRAESDFWIVESLKVLEVAIHNTRFYVSDAGKSEQVAELLTLIADIPPLVRQRALSPNGTRRLGFIVERANQIMRDIEQGIGRTPPEPTILGRLSHVKNALSAAWRIQFGGRWVAQRGQSDSTKVAERLQIGRFPGGKGVMIEGL